MSSNSILATLLLSCLYGVSLSLTPSFYAQTCPNVFSIIHSIIDDTLHNSDPRIAASLLRLHFHDCFVQGCDGSLLLDNSDTIRSEKDASANYNSVRGYEIVDAMKAALERECPGVVSCADILAIAAEESVSLSGGPNWPVLLGRRDSLTANFTAADTTMPSPYDNIDQLKAKLLARGLNTEDLVSLSGAHTLGRGQCSNFRTRLYNFNNTGKPDPNLNPNYREQLKLLCPPTTRGKSSLANLDVTTPDRFDNRYFTNLQGNKGLLLSDQELFSTPGADTVPIVNRFTNQSAFFRSFINSMIKMGNYRPLTGTQGEIRVNCRRVNGASMGSDEALVSSM